MNMESFSHRAQERNHREILVPESELIFTTSRAGGPGGQNVNKTETKVIARWNFENSPLLTDGQKQLIRENALLKNRINESGELVIYSQTERSQMRNKQKTIEIINDLVNSALNPPPERKPTKVPKKEKKKRLEEKRRQSDKKSLRKKLY